MATPWPQPPGTPGARGHDVETSVVDVVAGRLISDTSINGITGTMEIRGRKMEFDLRYPVLTLAQYNQFKPFETTNLLDDITFVLDGVTYTCVLVEEPFFAHWKGSIYRGRARLHQKDTD